MEWELGITDVPPRHWKKQEPCWDDEKLTASSSHTFYAVVAKLCETALQKRRGPEDSGIDDHLWNLKICSFQDALKPDRNPIERYLDSDSDDESKDEDSSNDDDSESKYRGRILVAPPDDREQYDRELNMDDLHFVASSEKLSPAILPEGHVVHLTYDFGTTTNLYLKVLRVRSAIVCSLLQYFELSGNEQADLRDLEAVPAYKLPDQKRIDAFYPHFSQAFLGHYVPLQEGQSPRAGDPTIAGSATLGLSTRIRSEQDTTFCTIENSDCSSDVFFAGQPFEDMQEFLEVSEKAWTPHSPDNDADHLDRYRYSMVSRQVFPSSPQADEVYDAVVAASKTEYAQFGPKMLFYRLSQNDKVKNDFDFAKVFPKTHAQFQSGKFRWIKYKSGVLRILVGRAAGFDHRQFGGQQVLRTWKRDFESLHELLCAVEASWVFKGKELDATTVLSDFDLDLGPSNPGPKEPELLGKEEDAVLVSKCGDAKKFVMAMAVAQENDVKAVLYSGHADGTLTKWCLVDNKQLWTKQAYPDGTKDNPHWNDCIGIHVSGTAGVAGLVVREKDDKHLVYTWTDVYNGYPDVECDGQCPAIVICWSGVDGSSLRSYECDVGLDENGAHAYPSIATVVFCRLRTIEDGWVDSMVVGMHCLCDPIDWEGDYSEFELEEAQEKGEGNILPFYEDTNSGAAMETWREHGGMIGAMAVVQHRNYLLSYSVRYGHGLPDALVLWSLKNPGVPLCRHDFWDPSRSRMKQNLTRLRAVAGISVSGSNFLLAGEYGDQIALVKVRDDNGARSLEVEGYGKIGMRGYEGDYHGSMAMFDKYAVMSNECCASVWIFDIENSAKHEKLDRREGDGRDFEPDPYNDDEDSEEAKYRSCGREIAVGRVVFPLFGGNKPRRKKRKLRMESGFEHRKSDESESESDDGVGIWTIDNKDGLGNGGPVSLAMYDKWLVAGFSNGSIVRAPFLPADFECTTTPKNKAGTSGLVSCSRLPTDEWKIPVLDYE